MDQLKYLWFLAASIFLSVLEGINVRWLDYNVVTEYVLIWGSVILILMHVLSLSALSCCLSKKRMSFGEVDKHLCLLRRLIFGLLSA